MVVFKIKGEREMEKREGERKIIKCCQIYGNSHLPTLKGLGAVNYEFRVSLVYTGRSVPAQTTV